MIPQSSAQQLYTFSRQCSYSTAHLFSPESQAGASLLEGDERLRSVWAPGEGELEQAKLIHAS